jgi:alkylation response protein AidB-like acyl-CoA dehydrogenase
MSNDGLDEAGRELLRGSIRRMLDRVAPLEEVARWDRDDRIPRENIRHLADLGLCMAAVPERFGGSGPDHRVIALAIEELSYRSPALASLLIQNAIYGSMNLLAAGSAEQQARLLPELAAGRLMFAYGLSEPNVGADLASVETRAERRGSYVVVNGAKRWCSGADICDFILALVRTGPAEARRANLSFLLIPSRCDGVTIRSLATMGMRGIKTCEVTFDDVVVPIENVLGGPDRWDRGWQQLVGPALDAEKIQVPAMAIGIARCALDEAWTYAQTRRQFGVPICAHQSVRHALVDARTKLLACQAMLDRALSAVCEDRDSAAETSMAKLFVAETACDIVLACQRVLGAYGYAEGFQMERLVRDVLVLPIWGGSSAIQRNNLASLLGLPRG